MSVLSAIKLSGSLEPEILYGVARRLATPGDHKVPVVLDADVATELQGLPAAADVVATTTVLAVVIKAILSTRIWLLRRRWSTGTVKRTIHSALESEGLSDCDIVDVANLDCLRGSGPCPCVITVVQQSTGLKLGIHIFLDGTVMTFRLSGAAS